MNSEISLDELKRVGLRSTSGSQPINQDGAYIRDYAGKIPKPRYLCLGAVADGTGGQQLGDIASTTAIQTLFGQFGSKKSNYEMDPSMDTAELLREIISQVNTRILELARQKNQLQKMGTTLTAFLAEEGTLYLIHVGNSRAYLIRGGTITLLTKDHPPEGNTGNTRFLGMSQAMEVDLLKVGIVPGDIIFLCTDGLYGFVSDQEILSSLNAAQDMQSACRELVRLAVRKGSNDNVTAISWMVPASVGTRETPLKERTPATAVSPDITPQVPQEKPAPRRAAPSIPTHRRKAKKLLVAMILVCVAVSGFFLGWWIAGLLEGNKGEKSEEVSIEQQNPTEQESVGEQGGMTATASERITFPVTLLNAKGKSGLAEEAKRKLESRGYSNVTCGNAIHDTQSIAYYQTGCRDKAIKVAQDLGITARYEENPSIASARSSDVVLVLDNFVP